MSVMGLGVLAGGNARAATTALPLAFTVTTGTGARSWRWGSTPATSTGGLTTEGIGNLTWAQSPSNFTSSTSSVTAFAINEGSVTTGTSTNDDWIDVAFQFAVDGTIYTNPDGNVDLTGNVLTSDVQSIGNIDANVEYVFGAGRPGVLRVTYILTNTDTLDHTTSLVIAGNVGSDSSTTVQKTQDGNTTIDSNDGWMITSDNTTVGGDTAGDPLFTFARFGHGAKSKPVPGNILGTDNGAGKDFFGETYTVTIPAGETRRVMVFAEMTTTLTEAKANAKSFNTAASLARDGMTTDLTTDQKHQTVNWDMFPSSGDSGGALEPTTLLVLSGWAAMAGLLRRRRQQ